MKLLIIICSNELDIKWCANIKILDDYIKENKDIQVDYCGISSNNDFHNYESIISFKFKIINSNKQLTKICDFITDYKSKLNYDWYIKIRPDMKLLENINFNILSKTAINARARLYKGPAKIKYGMSINGKGGSWSDIGDCYYDETEYDVILDDMFFIFHNNVIQLNAFDKIHFDGQEHEWFHTEIFNSRKIALNVIGIHLVNEKHNGFSGHIHI
jgi:hypothetical protein